jgi:hypothetical protein
MNVSYMIVHTHIRVYLVVVIVREKTLAGPVGVLLFTCLHSSLGDTVTDIWVGPTWDTHSTVANLIGGAAVIMSKTKLPTSCLVGTATFSTKLYIVIRLGIIDAVIQR